MLLAAYLTGAFCVAATGAWYVLRRKYHAESRIMLRMGLGLAAVLVPVQIFFGHLAGDYVHNYQPAKFAAIEARWHDEQPAGEVLIAIPDPTTETNRYEIKIPVLGSIIGSMSLTSKEVGLTATPEVTGNRSLSDVHVPQDLADVDIGVVRAVFAVAETGSICLADANLGVNARWAISRSI